MTNEMTESAVEAVLYCIRNTALNMETSYSLLTGCGMNDVEVLFAEERFNISMDEALEGCKESYTTPFDHYLDAMQLYIDSMRKRPYLEETKAHIEEEEL